MIKKLLLFVFVLSRIIVCAQESDSPIRVLIVIAHPGGESGIAATIYKLTHEQKGIADLAVITNGEAGYKYSFLAEPYYNLKLTDEAIGRKHLPTIRKKELMAAGSIIGIRNYFFFDQLDKHYTLDADTVMKKIWDVVLVKNRLTDIIEEGKYDFIFCALPTDETHGHQKAATIIALQTVSKLRLKKPTVLGFSVTSKTDTSNSVFHGLKKYKETTVSSPVPSFSVDRNESFGFENQLNYKIIVNWEIAEHKSQGSLQSNMNRGDYENFWNFDMNGKDTGGKVNKLFDSLNSFKHE